MLLRSRLFLVTCVLALSLSVGLSASIFSVLYAVVLKPLPFRQQDRLVVAWKTDRGDASKLLELSYLDYKDWRRQSRAFEDMAAMPTTVYGYSYVLTGNGDPVQIESARVTANYFSILGVKLFLGRTFTEDEDQVGANPVVILTHRFWRDRLGSDQNVIGKPVTLNNMSFTVVGVLPPDFVFPEGAEVFTPLATNPRWVQNRNAVFLQILGRLKPGVSLREAQAELDTITSRIAAQYPETRSQNHISVIKPLAEFITGNSKLLIYLLFVGSMALLLIAVVNLAGLISTRATGRIGETSLRVAIGASRLHLLKQFFAEALILSFVGISAGFVVSFWLVRFIARVAPRDIPRIGTASVNLWTLMFTVVLFAAITMVFAATPLLLLQEGRLTEVMRAATGQVTGGRRGVRLGRALVIIEVCVTLALLVLTGLISKSFQNLQNVKLGFDPGDVFTCSLALTGSKYQDPASRKELFKQLVDKLQANPEVAAAGGILLRPLEGPIGWDIHYLLPGQRPDEIDRNPMTNLEAITPSYFKAIGTPLIAGRFFDESDDRSKPLVAIVSEKVARSMYGSYSQALQQRFKLDAQVDSPWMTIVGIVSDARYRDLTGVVGDIFLPYTQTNLPIRYVIVRTKNAASDTAAIVRRSLSELSSGQAIGREFTMPDLVARSLAQRHFHSELFVLFGCVSLLLAAVGVYGVVSDVVAKQTKEIGIRMALGAQGWGIVALVLRSELSWVALAEALGILIASLVAIAIRPTLFGIGPFDAITVFGASGILFAAALVAAAPAALRAANTDPNKVLRLG
jgi:putative ABC transport system permease protein